MPTEFAMQIDSIMKRSIVLLKMNVDLIMWRALFCVTFPLRLTLYFTYSSSSRGTMSKIMKRRVTATRVDAPQQEKVVMADAINAII